MGRGRKFTTVELFDTTEQVLLVTGYEGFTIGLLAENLDVSRAAIYKYYTNKEELIADFMIERMEKLIAALQGIKNEQPFEQQLDELLKIIFQSKDLHQIIGYSHFIDARGNEEIAQKIEKLSKLHQEMYFPLQKMMDEGKKQNVLAEQLPNEMILGFIFQSIAIPNHSNLPKDVVTSALKRMIYNGIMA